MKEAMIDAVVTRALEEDLGTGDVTVEALVPLDLEGTGKVVAKEEGVLAGVHVAARTFELVDEGVRVSIDLFDGAALAPGDEILQVRGRAASLLVGERTALNFLQHLSGIATRTRRYVEAVSSTGAKILDTRKTTPGLRFLEKAAVRSGGGANHRMGLYDMVLVKDNHLALMGCRGEAEAVKEAVARARAFTGGRIPLEVETATVDGALAAAAAGADMILLDNMSLPEMAEAVKRIAALSGQSRPLLEASGGIGLETVRAVAETGVDRISVGALTHSVKALDIAMYVGFD